MPGQVRQVQFKDYASRRPEADELFVMNQYRSHADHCKPCAQPYKTFTRGSNLCDRGQAYAKDVRTYIYEPFSQKSGSQVRLEFPSTWDNQDRDLIQDLLKAIAAGLRFPTNKPVISQSPTRSYRAPEEYYGHEVIERVPTGNNRRAVQPVRQTEERVVGRGSLYRKDAADRQRRTKQDPIIITASPGIRVRESHYR